MNYDKNKGYQLSTFRMPFVLVFVGQIKGCWLLCDVMESIRRPDTIYPINGLFYGNNTIFYYFYYLLFTVQDTIHPINYHSMATILFTITFTTYYLQFRLQFNGLSMAAILFVHYYFYYLLFTVQDTIHPINGLSMATILFMYYYFYYLLFTFQDTIYPINGLSMVTIISIIT